MKKVIIALDYNPSAERVAEKGYEVAKAMGAEIMLVHVITEAAYYAYEYSPIMGFQSKFRKDTLALVEDIRKEAEEYLAASVKHLGDTAIKSMVLDGNTTDAILKCAGEWQADLLVMGSHSHHGIDRLLGSDTATQVLKHAKLALLTIPTDENSI